MSSAVGPSHGAGFAGDDLVRECPACRRVQAGGNSWCCSCQRSLADVLPVRFADTAPAADLRVEDPVGTAPFTCPRCDEPRAQDELPLCASCGALLPPRLELVVGARREVLRPGDVLGREGSVSADVFSAFDNVSRRHVEVRWSGEAWMVAAVQDATNGTWLDGRLIPRGEAAPLSRRRHVLQLAAHCRVTLELAGGANDE